MTLVFMLECLKGFAMFGYRMKEQKPPHNYKKLNFSHFYRSCERI